MSEVNVRMAEQLPARPPLRHRWISRYYRTPEHPSRLRLLRWLKRVLAIRVVQVEVAPGVIMELDDRDFVEREILNHGAYELATLRLFERLISSARGFVDIGAHHGQYSLRAARALAPRGGRVVAFEPMPLNAAALLRNAKLSRLTNIDLYCVALAQTPSVATMFLPSAGNTGGARLTSGYAATDAPALHVAVQSIADLAARWPAASLDLVKVDVEGREVDALAPLFATGFRPRNILLEFLPDHFDYGIPSVPAWLDAHGYEVLTVAGKPYRPGDPLPDDNLWARLRDAATSRDR
jgi:FkbM family methyltransferase